ncbi:MAG: transcription antitermination protein NusB, partial [Planctomycetota bacterium]|nr:transcription antitermination protein NusB [Planctomycetota bacterium]
DRAEGVDFALRTWECGRTLDDELNPLSPDWPLHRQPVLDRSILRLAAQEMTESPEQWKVVISEAIDLAREFSTEESPRFINGVLDRLQRERQRNQDQSGEADHGIVSPGD